MDHANRIKKRIMQNEWHEIFVQMHVNFLVNFIVVLRSDGVRNQFMIDLSLRHAPFRLKCSKLNIKVIIDPWGDLCM